MENQVTPQEVIDKINNSISEKMKTVATAEEVASLKGEVEGLKGLELKSSEYEKAIAKMEGKLEAMAEKSRDAGVVRLSAGAQAVKSLKDNMELILSGKSLELNIKADTTIAGDYTGTRALTELDPEINRLARQQIRVLDVVNKGTTNSMYVTYIQQTARPDATWLAEATAKTEYEEKYTEVSKQVKKVANIVKVSKEMLSDLSFVQGEINNDLLLGVQTKLENSLINGAGGLDLEGILSFASTFTAGTFTNTIISANILDVIRVSIAQIESSLFNATHVVLNPIDVAKMQLTKTTQGEYTMPIFYPTPAGDMKISQLTVVSTTFMTAGTFLVGDMTKCYLKMREDANITFGYVNDDFQRNMVSILGEARAVSYVKLNDVNAFVKGTLSVAIAALDPAI